MNVGWGKAETQFQGKAGKLSTQAPKAVAAEVPADDGKPRITWRGDGEFFVTSTLVRTVPTCDRVRWFGVRLAQRLLVHHAALCLCSRGWRAQVDRVCAPAGPWCTCADVRTMLMSLWQPQGSPRTEVAYLGSGRRAAVHGGTDWRAGAGACMAAARVVDSLHATVAAPVSVYIE